MSELQKLLKELKNQSVILQIPRKPYTNKLNNYFEDVLDKDDKKILNR